MRERPGGRLAAGGLAAGAVVVAVYCLVAVVAMWNVWSAHPTTTTVGGGDSYMDSWFLGYALQVLAHGHNPFFTTFGNYPYGINVLDNSSQLLLGFVGAPVTAAWGAIATFNVMITAGMALNATAAYALVRRFAPWRPAAFAGGLLYGFSPYVAVQSADGHLNIAFVALVPLIFLVLHDMLVRCPQRWARNGALLAVLAVAQFFVSTEVLLTTAVVAVVVVVAAAAAGHREVRARLAPVGRAIGLAAGVAGAVLAYPIWYTVAGPAHIVGPIQPVAQAYRADLLGAVIPNAVERIAPTGHLLRIAEGFAASPGENSSYLGIPLLVLSAVAVVWLWRDARVLVVAVAGAAAFVLSLGGALAVYKVPTIGPSGQASGGVPLPETLLSHIGPLRNIIPVRISLYVFLAAAVLLGIVVTRLHEAWRARLGAPAGAAGALAVAAVALAPLVPAIPFGPAVPIGVPAYFAAPAPRGVAPGSVTALYPYPSSLAPAPEAWLAYASLPVRVLGGYFLVPTATGTISYAGIGGYTRTGPLTTWLTELWKGQPVPESAAWRSTLRTQLRADGVRTVIAVPRDGADPAGALAHLEWLLGPPSAHRGGTVDWYHLHLAP